MTDIERKELDTFQHLSNMGKCFNKVELTRYLELVRLRKAELAEIIKNK